VEEKEKDTKCPRIKEKKDCVKTDIKKDNIFKIFVG